MTNPNAYSVGPAGYGSQPMYPVEQPLLDAAMGYHSSDGHGQAVHVVHEAGYGATPVYFVNGPPPGSVAAINADVARQQHAWAGSQPQTTGTRACLRCGGTR